jgi:hypothetical protein
MSTDKLFILLLVVLLPLTGCLDTVEPAGAESNDDDSIETIVQSPDVYSLHLQANTNATIVLNGTTLILEQVYREAPDSQGYDWTHSSAAVKVNMDCDDGTYMDAWIWGSSNDIYLPIIGGTECTVTFYPDNDAPETILIFSSHSIAALETTNQ